MTIQNPMLVRERIITIIKERGPSLPVHISKETGLSMLFASAFLSELLTNKEIRISNMKIGNSPLYFYPGQENKLESFGEHLKSKEKEAFLLLKEKRFLKDSEQHPAIRVALKSIRDFAFQFKYNDEIFWRYLTADDKDFENLIQSLKDNSKEQEQTNQEKTEPSNINSAAKLVEIIEAKREEAHKKGEEEPRIKLVIKPGKENEKASENLDIFDKEKMQEPSSKEPEKKPRAKKPKKKTQKQDQNFFNKIKEYLAKKDIEVLDIESFSKSELVLRVKANKKEQLAIAFNKKRISNEEIIKAHKKAKDLGIGFFVIQLGVLPKKLKDFLEAVKSIENIEGVE